MLLDMPSQLFQFHLSQHLRTRSNERNPNFETALLVYQLAALAMFQRRSPNTPVRLTRLFAIQTCSVTPLLTASSLCLYLAGIYHECGDG